MTPEPLNVGWYVFNEIPNFWATHVQPLAPYAALLGFGAAVTVTVGLVRFLLARLG